MEYRLEQIKGEKEYDMNYATMSENALLRTIIEEELCSYEARFGKAVCPRAKKVFISKMIRLAVILLLAVVLIKIIGQRSIITLALSSLNLLYVWGMILLIKFIKNRGLSTASGILPGSLNPVTNYIMILAKKNPDTKIKDIIYTVCLNTGSGQAAFLNGIPTQEQERRKRGVAIGISVFLILGLLGIGGYYFVPRASYTELETGYMLKDFKLGFSVEGEVVIPDTYNGRPVVAIDEGAFRGNPFMKTVELPDTILYIGGEAFKNCRRLESIRIPEGVMELRGNTFEGCSSLRYVDLPESIVEIHGECFLNCKKLQGIKLPPQITEIKGNTFEGCSSLQSLVIPEGVTRIAAYAFYGCSSLSEVSIPSTVTSIGSSAFRKCDRLNRIAVPEGVDINERAFKESPTVITYFTP